MSERSKIGNQLIEATDLIGGVPQPIAADRDLRPFGPEIPEPIGLKGRSRLVKTGLMMPSIAARARQAVIAEPMGDGQADLTINSRVEPVQRPAGYWKSPDNIRREAAEIIEAHGALTQRTMKLTQRSTISNAIRSHYPGGLVQLNRDLGIRGRKKSDGYWTPDAIEREAHEFVAQHGQFSVPALKAAGRLDLCVAIQKKYPGGFRVIQENLDIQPGHKLGYWTKEKIEEEARAFTQEHGGLSQKLLLKHARSDICTATKTYPGKLTGLKKELGLKVVEMSKGVRGLSPDDKKTYIEQKAKELVEKGQALINSQLIRNGYTGFLSVVQRSYPGGLAALQQELGINSKPQLSTEEANAALESLFGGEL